MKNKLGQVVESIKENADELKAKGKLNDVEYGELLGYAEALSIIKGVWAGYDLKDIGLDFDIDEKYL